MKVKMNKACDLASISVLPPRRTGGSASAPAASASASASASQPQSQQSFSQGQSGGGFLHSQSQLSQDENLLTLHLSSPPPARHQRFGLHDDSSKRAPSLPANASSASCVRDESQLQLAKVSTNPVHRWNPSLPDTTFQVPNEDVERKFQHLASSVHKIGMVLDSVQSDVMQLNRAMKEASLDSGSIRQKVVHLEDSLQQILKGQDDLKALLESSTRGNPDQLSVLNSHTSKLDEISSTLSVWPKQVQSDLRQLQGDIFRIFTKEMEGIVRAIRSLNSRPAGIQMLADQSCTTNDRSLRNQIPAANGKALTNQTQVANGRPQMNQTPVANGNAQMNQIPVANGRRIPMSPTPVATGRPQMNQRPITKVLPASLVYPSKVADPKAKVKQGKCKAAPKLAPKQEDGVRKVNPQVAVKKAPTSIIIESDDESEGRVSCVILKTETAGNLMAPPPACGAAAAEKAKLRKEGGGSEEEEEEGLHILRRARKRRRREMQSLSLVLAPVSGALN